MKALALILTFLTLNCGEHWDTLTMPKFVNVRVEISSEVSCPIMEVSVIKGNKWAYSLIDGYLVNPISHTFTLAASDEIWVEAYARKAHLEDEKFYGPYSLYPSNLAQDKFTGQNSTAFTILIMVTYTEDGEISIRMITEGFKTESENSNE